MSRLELSLGLRVGLLANLRLVGSVILARLVVLGLGLRDVGAEMPNDRRIFVEAISRVSRRFEEQLGVESVVHGTGSRMGQYLSSEIGETDEKKDQEENLGRFAYA